MKAAPADLRDRLYQPPDASHGGFDNNVEMVATTLRRITGAAQLALPVDDLVGF
ncbi:MAG: hypothetical protein ACYCWC_07980 [Rhodocyclaceae bacterium]